MSYVQLDYAYQNNNLVYIDDVDNGLSCNCICPICGEQLVAYNGGTKQSHHFQHYNGNEHDIHPMTRIHMLATYILAQKCTIIERTYSQYVKEYIPYNRFLKYAQMNNPKDVVISLIDGQSEFSRTYNGKRIQYDVYYPNEQFAIEIKVTHAVEPEKWKLIRKLGDSCLEIDLSSVPRDISYQSLRNYLDKLVIINNQKLYSNYHNTWNNRNIRYKYSEGSLITEQYKEQRYRVIEQCIMGAKIPEINNTIIQKLITKDENELIRYPIIQNSISKDLRKIPHIHHPYVLNRIKVHLELFDDMVVQHIFYDNNIIITNKYRVNLSTFNIPLLTIAMVDGAQYIRSADANTNTIYECPICHKDVFLLGKYFIHEDTPAHPQNRTDIKHVERDYRRYQYKHKYITPHVIVDSNKDPYPEYKSQNPELYTNLLIEISSQLLRNNTNPQLDALDATQLEMFKKLYERNSCLHYADNIKNYNLLVTPVAIYLYLSLIHISEPTRH